ncbi:MAG TPA: YbjQ family protein [Longimicrobiales bacterium]|nr:YbjQ family protein [Longimicrobiales bacterium]
MIVVTTADVAGHRIVETLGLVRGSSVRARHLGQDVVAELRNLAGGEIPEYTKILAETREQAIDRMVEEARALGADAVVTVRFESAEVTSGAAEMCCYGTAVRLERVEGATGR